MSDVQCPMFDVVVVMVGCVVILFMESFHVSFVDVIAVVVAVAVVVVFSW